MVRGPPRGRPLPGSRLAVLRVTPLSREPHGGGSQGSGVRDRGGVEGPSSFPRYRLSYFAVRSRYRSEKSKRQGTASHSNCKLEAGCLTDELIDSAY